MEGGIMIYDAGYLSTVHYIQRNNKTSFWNITRMPVERGWSKLKKQEDILEIKGQARAKFVQSLIMNLKVLFLEKCAIASTYGGL